MSNRSLWLVILLTLVLPVLNACGGIVEQQGPAQHASVEDAQVIVDNDAIVPGGEIAVGLGFDIAAVDPAFAYDFVTNAVVAQVTEGLLKYEQDGALAPNLAERWENPDPLTYIFHIRQDVTFQDGSPMTVEDVIFSLERIRDPNTASWVAWMYDSVDQIEQIDDWTISVTLKEPDVLLPHALATAAGNVVSKAHFEANAENYGNPEAGALGTGPFKYVSWSTGNEIVLERYDSYWNKNNGGPYLDRVVFKIVPDDMASVVALRTGELHMKFDVSADLVTTVDSMDNVEITFVDYLGAACVAFNTERPPFDNVKVRQALNYAVDTVEVTEALLGKAGTSARTTPVTPGMWIFEPGEWAAAYEALPAYDKDLDKAKQLLAESGVADQLDGKVITTHEGIDSMGHALALQAAAAELGFELEILALSVEDLVSTTSDGDHDYDIIRCFFASDFPDPASNFIAFFHSHNTGQGGFNFANYRNPEVDRLLDEQNSLTDSGQRTELLLQVQKIVADDAPMIFFNYGLSSMTLNKEFSGYELTPLWYWDAWAKNMHMKE